VATINAHGDIKYLAVDRSAVIAGNSFKVFVGADVIALTEALFMFDRYSWLRKKISRLVSHDPPLKEPYFPTPDTRSQDLIG
jgi:hypothetical protein